MAGKRILNFKPAKDTIDDCRLKSVPETTVADFVGKEMKSYWHKMW